MRSSDYFLCELDEIFINHGGISEALGKLNYSEFWVEQIIRSLSKKHDCRMRYIDPIKNIICELFVTYGPPIERYLNLIGITQKTFGSWLVESISKIINKREIRRSHT